MRKVAADRLTLAHTFVDRHIARTAAYNSRRDRSIFTIVCQTAAELTLRPGSFLLLLLVSSSSCSRSFHARSPSTTNLENSVSRACRPLRYNPVIVPQVCAYFHYKSLFPGDSIRFKILTPPLSLSCSFPRKTKPGFDREFPVHEEEEEGSTTRVNFKDARNESTSLRCWHEFPRVSRACRLSRDSNNL